MLAALIDVPAGIGYPLLFVLVATESAGALVPGETSLIVAAALAAQGQLSLPLVIGIAAGAAILGDNIGYLIGRRGLRRLLDRPGRWSARKRGLVERGEVFFVRRGSATVFFGRWLPGLRVVASWLAGANRMPWRRFLLWNALGGIAWASTVGAVAYLLGRSASSSLGAIGFAGVGIAALAYLTSRLRDRLRARPTEEQAGRTPARPAAAPATQPRRLNPTQSPRRLGCTRAKTLGGGVPERRADR
jgi:membrane protein DedA with SNARE-associated domain